MWEVFKDHIMSNPSTMVPIIAGAILSIGALIGLFVAIHFHRSNKLDFTDVITYDGEDNRVSLTKVLQLVGGLTGTWIVIQMALKGTLTFDIYGLYLAYIGSVETFSKFFRHKYGSKTGLSEEESK